MLGSAFAKCLSGSILNKGPRCNEGVISLPVELIYHLKPSDIKKCLS